MPAAIIFLVALQSGVDQPCVTDALPLIEGFKVCSTVKAALFEGSGESAGDIATAAVSACKDQKSQIVAKVQTCLPPSMVNDLANKLDEAGKKLATEFVVRYRAEHPKAPK